MCKTSSLCSSTYVTHTMPVGSVPHVSDTVLIAAAARKRKRKSEYTNAERYAMPRFLQLTLKPPTADAAPDEKK